MSRICEPCALYNSTYSEILSQNLFSLGKICKGRAVNNTKLYNNTSLFLFGQHVADSVAFAPSSISFLSSDSCLLGEV